MGRADRSTDGRVRMRGGFGAATPAAEPPVTAAQQALAQQPPAQQPQAQAAEPPTPPEPAVLPVSSPPVPSLAREEITALYKRTEQLIHQSDLPASPPMFARAASVGGTRAALALVSSYDQD